MLDIKESLFMKSKESRFNMKYILTSIIVSCICTSALPQSSYNEIDAEVQSWYAHFVESTSAISSKAPKTIDYTAQHYSVTGLFSKGILCEGTIAKFYDTSSSIPKLLLEGVVLYYANRLVVKGVKYGNIAAETNNTYGSFYVYNMNDFSMNYKAKKAGSLRIKCSDASYLKGFYLQCPVIVKLNDNISMVYVDGETGGRKFSFLSAQIPDITLNNDDSFDMTQILLRAKENVTISGKDGDVFKGCVKTELHEDKSILFHLLDGQFTDSISGSIKTSVSHTNGDIIYTKEDDDNDPLLSKVILYVKDNGTISEEDLWIWNKFCENCYLAKYFFRNGNYFEGTIKSIKANDSITTTTLGHGIFKYPNGDRFEGNSTKTAGSFYIDGTTFFADGSKSVGNWMDGFKLTNEQWEKVNSCQNPTEARELAKKLQRSNYYQDYHYSLSIGYFDPEFENLFLYNASYYESLNSLSYDKVKNSYTYPNFQNPKLTFAIDDNNRRKWEITYSNSNEPQYLNEYTWYENGIVESIKSYDYNTKELILACYFFSDGKIRSAYKYEKGNSGKKILRKSKESHPTFGGYTCKLYDLNGQYERSIDWGIYGILSYQYDTLVLKTHELKPIE